MYVYRYIDFSTSIMRDRVESMHLNACCIRGPFFLIVEIYCKQKLNFCLQIESIAPCRGLVLYFLPVNKSFALVVEFYGQSYYLAVDVFERFKIVLLLHLFFGGGHASVSR